MFPATITIEVSTGVNKILKRVNQDNFGSEYLLVDATTKNVLKIRHSKEGSNDPSKPVMVRHNVFFEYTVFPTTELPAYVRSYTMTMRRPELSNPSAVSDIAKGVQTWLGTSTNLADLAAGDN